MESLIHGSMPDAMIFCHIAGIALMTHHLSEQQARDAVKQVEDETGLPATDAIRFGVSNLMDALIRHPM